MCIRDSVRTAAVGFHRRGGSECSRDRDLSQLLGTADDLRVGVGRDHIFGARLYRAVHLLRREDGPRPQQKFPAHPFLQQTDGLQRPRGAVRPRVIEGDPVSYTHLDVYKRQAVIYTVMALGLTLSALRSAMLFWSDYLTTTHPLGVQKGGDDQ